MSSEALFAVLNNGTTLDYVYAALDPATGTRTTHVTRHTSHITHHTSHITRPPFPRITHTPSLHQRVTQLVRELGHTLRLRPRVTTHVRHIPTVYFCDILCMSFRLCVFVTLVRMYTLHDSQGLSPFRFNLIASRVTDGSVVHPPTPNFTTSFPYPIPLPQASNISLHGPNPNPTFDYIADLDSSLDSGSL